MAGNISRPSPRALAAVRWATLFGVGLDLGCPDALGLPARQSLLCQEGEENLLGHVVSFAGPRAKFCPRGTG